MLDSLKSIGCHTAISVATGICLGPVVVMNSLNSLCISKFTQAHYLEGRYNASESERILEDCQAQLIASSVLFGIIGGIIGLISGISREIFKRC